MTFVQLIFIGFLDLFPNDHGPILFNFWASVLSPTHQGAEHLVSRLVRYPRIIEVSSSDKRFIARGLVMKYCLSIIVTLFIPSLLFADVDPVWSSKILCRFKPNGTKATSI